MKRFLMSLLACAVSFSAVADQKISALPTASALTGTESIPAVQPGSCAATGGTCRTTPAAITTYMNSHAAISSGQVSGLAASATTDTTNAANISVGILPIVHGGTGANSLSGAFIPIFSGSITTGNCVKWLSATSIGDSGGTCGGGGGGTPGGTSGQVQYNNAGAFGGVAVTAGQVLQGGATPTGTATPTLGASGTLGSVTMGNATSGTVTVQPVAGALGAVTASLPANTGTLAETNLAETWSALQTFGTSISIGGVTASGATGTGNIVYATSPTIASPTWSGTVTTPITGSIQCLHVSSLGVLSGTGSDCGSGGSTAFSALTAGTNTTAAMVIGTGGSLAASGSGTITATAAPFSGLATGTNTTATLTVGTGGTITPSGTGVINADQMNGLAVPVSAALTATNGSGQFTGITLGNGLVISSGTLATTFGTNAQVGTTYTVVAGDAGKLLTFSNASPVAVTLPQGTGSFGAGFGFDVQNLGAGTATITPTTSTINGASSLAIAQGRGCSITSDGTNYQISACTAVLAGGTGSVTSVAMTLPTGWSVSGSPITTSGTLALSKSGDVVGGTKFTTTPTGCTPSATAGGATAGTITLAAGPCTSIVITMNGATGLTAPTGWRCAVADRTTQNAGTWIPAWGESATSTTTATIPIPAAAGATDVIAFSCTGY